MDVWAAAGWCSSADGALGAVGASDFLDLVVTMALPAARAGSGRKRSSDVVLYRRNCCLLEVQQTRTAGAVKRLANQWWSRREVISGLVATELGRRLL